MKSVLMDNPLKWGRYIRQARKKRGITQEKVAGKMGSPRMVIYHLEVKQSSNMKTVFRYLRAAGLAMKIIPRNQIMADTVLSMKNYSDVLRWSRNLNKVTLEEAAKAAGVSVQTILNLESGHNVSANTVFILLSYYHMKIEINEKTKLGPTQPSADRVVDILQHRGDDADGHEAAGLTRKNDD